MASSSPARLRPLGWALLLLGRLLGLSTLAAASASLYVLLFALPEGWSSPTMFSSICALSFLSFLLAGLVSAAGRRLLGKPDTVASWALYLLLDVPSRLRRPHSSQ